MPSKKHKEKDGVTRGAEPILRKDEQDPGERSHLIYTDSIKSFMDIAGKRER
jgi:hypothetical protein